MRHAGVAKRVLRWVLEQNFVSNVVSSDADISLNSLPLQMGLGTCAEMPQKVCFSLGYVKSIFTQPQSCLFEHLRLELCQFRFQKNYYVTEVGRKRADRYASSEEEGEVKSSRMEPGKKGKGEEGFANRVLCHNVRIQGGPGVTRWHTSCDQMVLQLLYQFRVM